MLTMRVCRCGNRRPAAVILGRLQNLEILLEDPVTESSELVDFGAFSSPCIEESFGLEFQAMYLSKISQYNNRVIMAHQSATLNKLENFMHARVASAINDCPTQNSTLVNTITRIQRCLSKSRRKNHPLNCVKNLDHNGFVPCRAPWINSGARVYIFDHSIIRHIKVAGTRQTD